MARPNTDKPPKYAVLQRAALGLPGTREVHDRHGIWFNIGKKTFALYGAPSGRWIFRLPHDQIRMLVEAAPEIFTPMRNATMLWLYVDVDRLSDDELRGYVLAAWRHLAPKKLQASVAMK